MLKDQTVKVFNLNSEEELHFDRNTVREYAVRYAYCTEQHPELASWFFACVQDNKHGEIEERLPLERGVVSIACGDWACLMEGAGP